MISPHTESTWQMKGKISWKPERLIIPLPIWALFHLTDTSAARTSAYLKQTCQPFPISNSPHPFAHFHLIHQGEPVPPSALWERGGAFVFRVCDNVQPCAICFVGKSLGPEGFSPICEVQRNCCCQSGGFKSEVKSDVTKKMLVHGDRIFWFQKSVDSSHHLP